MSSIKSHIIEATNKKIDDCAGTKMDEDKLKQILGIIKQI